MSDGLYQRCRPIKIEDVIGQPEAVKIVRGFGKNIPNAVIAVGGTSGSGKTTVLRILARIIGCPPENTFDYQEINCGSVDPIDTVRGIGRSMNTSALQGNARVYLLDECQTFSRSKGAQEALLKILEDGPNHAYFFLATTEPKRILKTILTRCTKIPFGAIPNADLDALIRKVAAAEKIEITDQLVGAIVEVAAGSGRTALVELEKVAGIKDPKDKLAAVSRIGTEKIGFDLAKELIPFKGTPSWGSVRAILKAIPKEEEHESIRAVILALAYTALTEDRGGREDQAYKVIKCLKEPMYDRVSARALLGAACYQIVNSK